MTETARDPERRCSECRFYERKPDPMFPGGECRVRAPDLSRRVHVDSRTEIHFGAWPHVPPDAWCGEHQPA